MRKILFKAESVSDKKYDGSPVWYEGGYVSYLPYTPEAISSEQGIKDAEKNTKHYIFSEGFSDYSMPRELEKHEINPHTLCQFTGIRLPVKGFKMPSMVWENDVVEVKNSLGVWVEGVVEWNESICAFVVNDIQTGENLSILSDIADIRKTGRNIFKEK